MKLSRHNFFQKMNKQICFSILTIYFDFKFLVFPQLLGQKSKFVCSFFGQNYCLKILFRDLLTFSRCMIDRESKMAHIKWISTYLHQDKHHEVFMNPNLMIPDFSVYFLLFPYPKKFSLFDRKNDTIDMLLLLDQFKNFA